MHRRWVFWLTLAVLCTLGPLARNASAQPNGTEMCGDGTTFRVTLPGTFPLPDGGVSPSEFINLPNGCSIYALLVSGYERNKNFDELTFYALAQFVASHNGYVHYAWWNNLLKPYMDGPLHDRNVNIPLLGTFRASPGGLAGVHALGFAPLGVGNNVSTLFPKAIPEEDHQFQADAELMLKAIRTHNPNAIIIVAGHSMGGSAVARLGASTTQIIDLLAPIDPVGNRTYPLGNSAKNYNWTRWRATHAFTGYRQVDCVRDDNVLNTCKDFDSRLLFKEYRCGPIGPKLNEPPLVPSKAPGICTGPWVDPGTRIQLKANIRHLLHRWQREAVFPFDYEKDERFDYAGTDTPSVPGPLIAAQEGLGKNGPFEADPQKTCSNPTQKDPRDDALNCNGLDGHGEIVGFRGLDANGAVPVGLKAQWAPTVNRRAKLIEMAEAPAPSPFKKSTHANIPPVWQHEPLNPNLDMVADDLIRIVEKVLDDQPSPPDGTAPVSVSSLDPGPNAAGWHNTDVDVQITAGDDAGGSGVKEIAYSFSGAQTADMTVLGDTLQDTIDAEGITTIQFFARDNAGNVEPLQTFDVKIDKTSPLIQAVPDIPPNPSGWNNTSVTVRFSASDSLSGLASSTADILVSDEGADQEIVGSAVDNADNQSVAAVLVSMDKTPPTISIGTPLPGAVYPLGTGVNTVFACADALSGMHSCSGPAASGNPLDTATAGERQFVVSATDMAGNVSHLTHNYSVVLGLPRLAVTVAGKGRDAGGSFYVDLQFRNTGTGHARGAKINDLVLRVLNGTGSITPDPALSPALPHIVGDLEAGAAIIHRVYLSLPSTVLRFSITESGAALNALGTPFTYSLMQTVIP